VTKTALNGPKRTRSSGWAGPKGDVQNGVAPLPASEASNPSGATSFVAQCSINRTAQSPARFSRSYLMWCAVSMALRMLSACALRSSPLLASLLHSSLRRQSATY